MSLLSGPVVFACDHGGFDYKALILKTLKERDLDVIDLGTHSPESVDYPDYGYKAAEAIAEGRATSGVIVCGSGIGISIAANRVPGARAALCQTELMAKLSREHNDANILALGARLIGPAVVEACVNTFFSTPFEGGRHARRVALLDRAG